MLYAIINSDSGFALLINIVFSFTFLLKLKCFTCSSSTDNSCHYVTAMADAVRLPAFNSSKMFFIEIGLWCVSCIVWVKITGIAKVLIKNIWQVLFTAEIYKKYIFYSLKAFLSLTIGMIDKSFALYWCFYPSILPFFRKHCALPISRDVN